MKAIVITLLVVAAGLGCRRGPPRTADRDADGNRPNLLVDSLSPPVPCTNDGWCPAGPYLPQVQVLEDPAESWALVEGRWLFVKRIGKGWKSIPLPEDGVAEIGAGGDGMVWVLGWPCGRRAERAACSTTHAYQYVAGRWVAHALPGHVYSIWGVHPGDVWAVGGKNGKDGSRAQVSHWTGVVWVPQPIDADQVHPWGVLKKALGIGVNDVWAAGGRTIIHWDGRKWKSMPPILVDDFGESRKEPQHDRSALCDYREIFLDAGRIVIASVPAYLGCTAQIQEQGLGWLTAREMHSPADRELWGRDGGVPLGESALSFKRAGRTMFSVAKDGGSIWVGYEGWWDRESNGNQAVVASFDGRTWQEHTFDPKGLSFSGSDWEGKQYSTVAVGDAVYSLSTSNGLACFRDGRWDFSHASVQAIFATKDLPLFILSPVGLERWSSFPGAKTGAVGLRDDQSRLHLPAAVWASAADEAWVIAKLLLPIGRRMEQVERPQVFHAVFDEPSRILEETAAPLCTYRGIHGTGKTDVWIVGDEGCILHFNGIDWSRSPSGVKEDLYAVWACTAGEAWAVGEGGTILQWDGKAWRSRSSGTAKDLFGITGCLSNDIWVVGARGTVRKHGRDNVEPAPSISGRGGRYESR
jgi:hypothetical protein